LIDIWDFDEGALGASKDYLCRATIHLRDGSARLLDKDHNVTYETDFIRDHR
jgi:hypothetical protein